VSQPDWQERFIKDLKEEQGLSANTIRKVIVVGRSAFHWAFKRKEISEVPYFEPIKVPQPPPKGRHLEVSEIANLLRLTELDHMKLFLLMLIGTAARPQSIYDLRFEQVNFDLSLIDLNPVGSAQSANKRRPVVKLPTQLCEILKRRQTSSESGAVIEYRGKPIGSVRTTWRKLRIKAWYDNQVMLYSFRRTMARYLRMKGVPAWELAEQLGHRSTGYQITELYTSHSPDYLHRAMAAIDDFFGELSCEFRAKNLAEIIGE